MNDVAETLRRGALARGTKTVGWTVLWTLAMGLTGCMGVDPASTSTGLVEVRSDTEPLEHIDEDASWEDAPAGCEDRLGSDVSFKVASTADALIAAISPSGEIVCVDSVESVQVELEEDGRDDEARELLVRYLATIVSLPNPDDLWDDPSPQPSVADPEMTPGGIDEGDPSPQPS